MPFLHVQTRCVPPPKNVNRSVMIGMNSEATMIAGKGRLALAAVSVDDSAFRTGLRGVGWIHGDEFAAAFLKFVFQHNAEYAPSLIQDRAIKSGFRPYVAPRHLNCANRACCHVGDFQIFHDNRSEAVSNRAAGLVMPVLADAGALGGKASCALEGLETALRSFLAARNDALRFSISLVEHIKAGRERHHFSGRKRQGVCYAAINTDRFRTFRTVDNLNLACERDIPSKRRRRDCRAANPSESASCVTEFYPSNFGEPNSGPLSIQAVNFDFAPMKSKRIVYPLLSMLWVRGFLSKESLEGIVKVAERVKFALLCDLTYKSELFSKILQFRLLRKVIKFMGSPPCLPLLKREIIDKAANSRELAKLFFLLSGRIKFEFEAAMDYHMIRSQVRSIGSGSRGRRSVSSTRRSRNLLEIGLIGFSSSAESCQ